MKHTIFVTKLAAACVGLQFLVLQPAMAICKNTNTIGADYGQASYNCEAVLQGQLGYCNPTGNMWVCRCATGCYDNGGNSGWKYTATIGASYGQARYNCEAVMQGQPQNCHPDGNMWVCGCYY